MKTQFPPQLQENEIQPGPAWRKGRLSWLPVLLILVTALPGLAAVPARDAIPPAPAAISPGGQLPLLWDNQCVDCPKTIVRTGERSLHLDAQGRPHIAYGGDHLYYAWFDGNAWNRQTVDPSPGVGLFTSLVLDGNGHPHISYCKGLEPDPLTMCDDLRYARWNGRVWQIRTVDSDGWAGNSSSISLDQAGHPHIAYISNPISSTGLQLQYARWTGSTWEIETVVSRTVVGISITCSLALDGEGSPQISYYDSAESALKFARRVDGGWMTETVDGAGFPTSYNSLALDGSGAAHIAYTTTSGDLKYARWMDGAWNVQTVDSTHESSATSASLALDAAGNPHISYYDSYHNNLKHIYWSGSQWFFEAFSGNSGYISDVSLALGPGGAPHLAYFDRGRSTLQYLVRQGQTWIDQTVDRDERVGSPLSFRLDSSWNAHLVYTGVLFSSEFPSSLKYARQSGNTWDFQTIEEGASPGGLNSLALDQNGYPHISYYSNKELDLKYAYWDGSQWQVQVVDRVGLSGKSSIAIDRAGRPHISYYNDNSRSINYAHWTGSAWEIQTVGNVGFFGWVSTLVLDAAGVPHINFIHYQSSAARLKYARWTGSDWEIQTIDEDSVSTSSLVLDAAGLPHLVYVSYNSFTSSINLKYTRWTGSAWKTEVVDDRSIPILSTALVLDELGRPHISYSTYSEIMYTRWNGAAWEFRTVDYQRYTSSSLALDGDGGPQVCYVDDALGDLRCAIGVPAASVISLPLISLAR